MPEKKLMTTDELVSELAARLEVPKSLVRRLLAELARTARQVAKTKGVFVLPGIGRLVKVHAKARLGRNPNTGDPIQITERTSVRFRVEGSFKSRLQGHKREKADVKFAGRDRAQGQYIKRDVKDVISTHDDAHVPPPCLGRWAFL